MKLFTFFVTVLTNIRLVTLERNFIPLTKVNHPSLLSESCLAGSELLGSQFS